MVEPTDACLQFCYSRDMRAPKGGRVEARRESTGTLLVASESWHESHFKKIEKAEPVKIQGREADLAILDEVGEFAEAEILNELTAYIRKTYGEHYAKDGVQAFALIAKRPQRGLNFALGNVIKYSDRFGQKGGNNRADLLKVAHYSILALHCAAQLEKAQ